jgi:ribonuclease P/MRP protein subunit RPP40
VEASNYRPISLTSVVLKLLERIIRDQLANHLASNRLLIASQHGFTKRRSCTTNLLCFMDEITGRLDKGERVEVCYLDFRKAFDSVNHRLLLRKLRAYMLAPGLLDWIEEFLTGRSFIVEVEGEKSATGTVISGVPQGSVLGPLLFLLYIHDLTTVLNCPHYMFADDVKIVGDPGKLRLQNDLQHLSQWTKAWQLPLNVAKCQLLSVIGQRHRGLSIDTDARVTH